jgi:hypothetical protein
MIYTYDEICRMPTITQGHTANLKYDDGTIRIWRSRMTIADGELDPIQVEKLVDGSWIDVTRGPDQVYIVQGQGCRAGIRTPSGYIRDNNGSYQYE